MKSYKEITLAGKVYPVAFNKYAISEFTRAAGIDLEGLSEIKNDLKTIQQLTYYGLVGGWAAKHEAIFPMSYIKACVELFDKTEELIPIMEVWAEHMPDAVEKPAKATKAKGEGKL